MTAQIAYISFDQVPAPKGAATHILAFVKTLTRIGEVHLVTVSLTPQPIEYPAPFPGVHHIALPAVGMTLIDRVLCFRRHLMFWMRERWFDVIHIRSIYEGFPIACQPRRGALVFEVNGLPSIELKYRYPRVAEDPVLMYKLRRQEEVCLSVADQILTPSHVTRSYLERRLGSPSSEKITVIANGVDLRIFTYQPAKRQGSLNPLRLVYFGTAAGWQGVGIALEALALYRREQAAQLTLIAPLRSTQERELRTQLKRLGLTEAVRLQAPVSQPKLVPFLHDADGILVPLTANDRNLVQGCCPLKLLEGMAVGTPVVTTDLPVVHELGEPDDHFLVVKPGSPNSLKEALLRLGQDESLRRHVGKMARQQIEGHYTWEQAGQQLIEVYERLLSNTLS